MRFQRIYEAVNFQPWFISAPGYSSVRSLVEKAMQREKGDLGDIFADFVRLRPEMQFDNASKTATISIFGILGPHLSNIEKSCGNTSYEDIRSEIEQAKAMGAERINFVIDSPGGAVMGCDETAKAISALKDETSIITVAFTDTIMCSAAYYLASGCTAIVGTRSAMIGNIGVILPWVDSSGEWEMLGLKFEPFVNEEADLKSAMHGPSLTESQREFLQTRANTLGKMFLGHVEAQRGEYLDEEVWRAGWYGGDDALRLGLIDVVGNSVGDI